MQFVRLGRLYPRLDVLYLIMQTTFITRYDLYHRIFMQFLRSDYFRILFINIYITQKQIKAD